MGCTQAVARTVRWERAAQAQPEATSPTNASAPHVRRIPPSQSMASFWMSGKISQSFASLYGDGDACEV